MKMIQKTMGACRAGAGFLAVKVIRWAAGISLAMFLAVPAFAQYPGSTGSGMPSYGPSGKAIGIGVGAAAGAGVLYLTLHHGSSVTGCVQSGDDGLNLVTDKDQKSYRLLPGGADLVPGERVALKGKKSQTGSAGQSFQPKKLVKNLGACGATSASSTSLSQPASIQSAQKPPLY
jgi:hypothetical protein